MAEFIAFEMQPRTGKTEICRVLSKSSGAVLGTIAWWGAWRQYVFHPAASCIFSMGCLEDINAQIRQMRDSRKTERAAAKGGQGGAA